MKVNNWRKESSYWLVFMLVAITTLLIVMLSGCGKQYKCDWCYEYYYGKGTQLANGYTLCENCVTQLQALGRYVLGKHPMQCDSELWDYIYGMVYWRNEPETIKVDDETEFFGHDI